MRLTTGAMLQNRYRIVSLLGQGGMGAVYRAWDTRLNIPLALKEMTPQPGLAPDMLAQFRRQFQQEAATLARLNHPHLVRVTDFFEEGGNTYLVMDFVEGENLADRIERLGALPEKDVLTWAEHLLSALTYCHDQGIIHRDVKPQNVIIRPGGAAVLVDFGLVKLWDPHDPRTKTAMRGMGTPEYAPPEQYEAEMGHTDARSDVYGVGATLYHALAGQAPPTATLRMASPERFTPVRSLNPRVSQQTETAILRAMELARSQRWQSTREMAQALGGKVFAPARPPATPPRDKTKVLAGSMPAGARLVVPARRRVPAWVWVVGVVAVLSLVLCVALVWGGRELIIRGQAAMTTTAQAQSTAIVRARATSTAQATQSTATAQAAQATSAAEAAQATDDARAAQATAAAQASRATVEAAQDIVATQSAQATATAEASMGEPPPAASLWSVTLYDDFSSNVNNWPTGDSTDALANLNQSITDGKYRWDIDAIGGVVWWSYPHMTALSDFYLTVEAHQISGARDSQYGVIFRRTDSGNYALFEIEEDSQHFRFTIRHDDKWDTVTDWTSTSAIRPGEVNRLGIVAEGSHFTFYVNDQFVGEADDDRLDSGKMGVAVELDAGDTAIFEFDNFEVRAP